MEAHTRAGKPGWLGRAWLSGFCVMLALWCVICSSGCTRQFFRKRADDEVGRVLAEKDQDPAWKIAHWHVYPDPRARFADPTDPDRPPKPPDDPAAYDLSPNPQRPGKFGVDRIEGTGFLDLLAVWDAENRAEAATVEKSEIRNPKSEKGEAGPAEKMAVSPKEVSQPEAKQKAAPGPGETPPVPAKAK